MSVTFADGRYITASLRRNAFESTSTLSSSTYLPRSSQLRLRTTRGDDVVVDMPLPSRLAPISDRPTIYLDQNHWSTLTNSIYDPDRVASNAEREAALRIIQLADAKKIILPMSSAHISETCKQADPEQRYRRALTIAQFSAGWQLRDPLELRRFEIRQVLALRYRHLCLIRPAAVTLEPNAIHSGRDGGPPPVVSNFPSEARWAIHSISCIGGILDALLDADHVPMPVSPGWAAGFQRFSAFLKSDPSGKELKRRRTHVKFIADLGRELPEEAHHAGVTPQEMSEWTLSHSEEDLHRMPALGLFREVLHEKLCDGRLRWRDNDLTDMMYLTAAAGYCDHVVGERAHAAHIVNGLRRMDRKTLIHRNLRSLVLHLQP
jgi:hypothetical protein